TSMKLAGMSVALAGIILISLRDGWTFSRETMAGDLLPFCGVCAFAYYTVAGKGVIPRMGVMRTTALSFLTGGVAMVPLVLPATLRQDWGSVTPRAWAGLAYVVLVGTSLCYFLYYWALSRVESGRPEEHTSELQSRFAVACPPLFRSIPRMGVMRTTALSFLTGGVAMVPLVLPATLRQDWGSVTPRAWAGLAYVVLVGTSLCYFLYYWALSRVESG